jgi:hypothetical protein
MHWSDPIRNAPPNLHSGHATAPINRRQWETPNSFSMSAIIGCVKPPLAEFRKVVGDDVLPNNPVRVELSLVSRVELTSAPHPRAHRNDLLTYVFVQAETRHGPNRRHDRGYGNRS